MARNGYGRFADTDLFACNLGVSALDRASCLAAFEPFA
ncbi:hypothetical protein NBRC3188_1460 [Acetobacter pasteurianus NBRC 3188]|uniref:Uncharacterized protein n=1 Tax=Acetobacter pasteurianus NBRC 3188 TaxID=1226663 RepID=A0A401WTT8_ACEPA|nr:hypothetical protein NBRC3188_1460 [Acetobacter pasteurianus NBRC 3188]